MSTQLDIAAGSISVTYSGTTDQNGQTIPGTQLGVTDSITFDEAGVEVTTSIPVVMPVHASAGVYNWSDAAAWDDRYLVVQGAAQITSVIQGIDSPVSIARTIFEETDTLQNSGPTNQSAFTFPIATTDWFGLPVTFSIALNIAYDVTISNGAEIFADQPNVDIYALQIETGGLLFAGSNEFAIDTNVMNAGQLSIESGPGITIKGDFFNHGSLTVGGTLVVQGTVFNDGTIKAQSGIFSISEPIYNLHGTIIADLGGSVYVGGAINFGTVVASGGVVDVGPGGALVGTVLSADTTGVFEGTVGFNIPDGRLGSFLQDVSIEAGTTYTALSGNITALRGTIDNAGVLFGANGSTFAIDGPVTLTGGGHLALTGGNIAAASQVYLYGRLPDRGVLTNLSTIDGQGVIGYGNDPTVTPHVQLVNGTGGIIDANVAGYALTLAASSITNQGLIEATNGGTLSVSNTAIDNTGSTVAALAGSQVQVNVGGAINFGTVVASGGVVDVGPGGALVGTVLSADTTGVFEGTVGFNIPDGRLGSFLQDVSIEAGTTYTALSGNITALRGTIDNAGVLFGANGSTFAIDGPVTLTGGGHLALTGGNIAAASQVYLYGRLPDRGVLTNLSTIDGQGVIGYGNDPTVTPHVQLVNGTGGIIDANVAGYALTLAASSITNQGLIEATNGGVLRITTSQIDNFGGAFSIDGNSGIEIGNTGSVSLGVISIDNDATFAGTGNLSGDICVNGLLDAQAGTLAISGNATGVGTLRIENGASLELSSSVASTLHISFGGPGTLKVDDAADFASTIAGLGIGDTIDLSHVVVTSASASGSNLVVTDASGQITIFHLVSPLDNTDVILTSDGVAGTNITIVGGHVVPTVSSLVAEPSGGNLNAGHVVALSLNFTEAVAVGGGIPTLSLNDSGTAYYNPTATTALNDPASLVFVYTVAAGENTDELTITAFNLNGASIQDGSGNSADLSGAVTNPPGSLRVDTTPPAVNESLANDVGISSIDKVTNDATLTGSGDPNSIVHFTVDGTSILNTVVADNKGNWTFGPSGLSDGMHTIIASETDLAGNVGTSAALTFTLDTISPIDAITNDILNKNGSFSLTGTTETGSVVLIHDGTTLLGSSTPSNTGQWSFSTAALPSNTQHNFTSMATDVAGNVGHSSGAAIYGSGGNDSIVSTSGNDLLAGGNGMDKFVFAIAMFGKDVITDFVSTGKSHDILQFDHSIFATAADALNHAAQLGKDVIIAFDVADTLTLTGVHLNQLTASDFHIV
ncbi:Ig-like domain-containing protein [Bradyrhizobium sp. 169]|uniref:beta strand repeat-containing protein n=1 Tax=Bradyrhizobium sp. 169 TaxID=2782640 RepID=UPI001FFB3B67|nr:Ig-like domain-containing protein [Bradyrhizobium sp. 169]MCK1586910.1 hypothetical protein [Bradyrhizobium sp. 169]